MLLHYVSTLLFGTFAAKKQDRMRYLAKATYAIIGATLVAAFSGCGDHKPNVPDTKGIKIDYVSHRFEQDLFSLDTNQLGVGLEKMKGKYPGFLDYFLDTLMAYDIHGKYSDTVDGIKNGLKPFLSFKDYRDLQDSITAHYADVRSVDGELSAAFKLMKMYLPERKVPEVYYLNLGLSRWPSFPVDSNTQCVALDMFLGDNFPHYAAVGAPQYLAPHRRENYIPVSVLSSMYRGWYPWNPQEKSLLELMIDKGREQYFLHMLLPEKPDSVLFGFSKDNIAWCEANEGLIYNFFVQNKLLYSKVAMDVMSYVTDGPFARGLEPVSNPVKVTPGAVGTWLGYKIVASYMENNPKETLSSLLNKQLTQEQFLAAARYKPKK